jgi:hypothetical protein
VGRGFDSIDLTNATNVQVQMVKGAAERAINILRDSHVSVYSIDPTLSTKLLGATPPEQTTSDVQGAAAANLKPLAKLRRAGACPVVIHGELLTFGDSLMTHGVKMV